MKNRIAQPNSVDHKPIYRRGMKVIPIRKMVEEPEIAIVGTKGQIVIPQQIRNDLGIEPNTRLAIYRKGDMIVVTKLRIPPLVEDLKEFLKEVDEDRRDRKRITEREILEEIQTYRRERRTKQSV